MPTTDHCAFILRLRRSAPGRYAVTVQFAAPSAVTDADLLGGATPEIDLRLEPLRAAGAEAAAIGRALSEQVFAARPLYGAYVKATTLADSIGLPLRIRLDRDPTDAELHSLPWELLRDPDDADHLAFSETALLSRLLPTATPRLLRRPQRAALRACIAVAAPTDLAGWSLAAIDADEEIRNARAALGARRLHCPISARSDTQRPPSARPAPAAPPAPALTRSARPAPAAPPAQAPLPTPRRPVSVTHCPAVAALSVHPRTTPGRTGHPAGRAAPGRSDTSSAPPCGA